MQQNIFINCAGVFEKSTIHRNKTVLRGYLNELAKYTAAHDLTLKKQMAIYKACFLNKDKRLPLNKELRALLAAVNECNSPAALNDLQHKINLHGFNSLLEEGK